MSLCFFTLTGVIFYLKVFDKKNIENPSDAITNLRDLLIDQEENKEEEAKIDLMFVFSHPVSE